jgi:hypothetical protein
MVQQGNSIIMTVEEFRIADQSLMITTVEKLKGDLRLNYWEELLDVCKAGEDLGVSKSTIYKWKGQEISPMPFKGDPARITRREARDWFNKFSNIYSK